MKIMVIANCRLSANINIAPMCAKITNKTKGF